MPLSSELLEILACPKCKADLTLSGDEKSLICESCRLSYPVREGIPVMLVEEASPWGTGAEVRGGKEGPTAPTPSKETMRLAIVEGKNVGTVMTVEKGTCRALGRSLDETERTRVFSVESTVSLDDQSKKLVMSYINKQFRKPAPARPGGGDVNLGGFRRAADIQVADSAVSRLHAMIFYDEAGIGILDLVSRNGTFVNGVEVESKMLKKGDLVTIGGTKIRFEGP